MNDWKLIRTFQNSIKANVYLQRLNDLGIPYVTGNETMANVLPLGVNTDMSVHVHVPASREVEVTELFSALDASEADENSTAYKSYGADAIDRGLELSPKNPANDKRRTLSIISAVIAVLIIILLLMSLFS